jgi:uncharacterized OsmC-like protein
MRTISAPISSGVKTRSMQPLEMALSGMSGCLALAGDCAMVMPPIA